MDRRTFVKTTAFGTLGSQTFAAPALARNVIEIEIVSSWPRNFPGLGISAQNLVRRINELSDGAIKAHYFAAGEKVGPFDVLDDVASGNSQAYISADYYFVGKHPALAYFCTVPMGMVQHEWGAWYRYRGGREICDRISGEFGIKPLPCGSPGLQSGGWFRKEIDTPDDLKGLKIRIPGLGGRVYTKLGASAVTLSGGQIYENLMTGAIDATEWVGPYNDYYMKFYDAARYYYTAGMQETGGAISFGMNASWWHGLDAHTQALLTAACWEEQGRHYDEAISKNGEYMKRLVSEHGVKLRAYSDDLWDAFGEAASEVFEEIRDHSALAAEVDDHFRTNMRDLGGYFGQFETQYTNQRNRVFNI